VGPCISPFFCLSPVTDSQCILRIVSIPFLTVFLATPAEMPQTVSGPISGHSDSNYASWLAVSLPTTGTTLPVEENVPTVHPSVTLKSQTTCPIWWEFEAGWIRISAHETFSKLLFLVQIYRILLHFATHTHAHIYTKPF
jgi:hypothetical protein